MPTGIKGFQKGHIIFAGVERGWFQPGTVPVGGVATRFQKGHSSYLRSKDWRENMAEIKRGKAAPWKKGERCEFWKGGMTQLQKVLRTCSRYLNWRFQVFLRDKFCCVECGVRGSRKNFINADHKKAFSVILQENNIKTLEESQNCEELWDINNGRTLCVPCHKLTPTWGMNL